MKTFLLALALAAAAIAEPTRLTGKVVRVLDGDTVKVRFATGEQSVRLDSIDAPESHQARGVESRRALQGQLPEGSTVRVTSFGRDRYRRIIGQLYRPDGANVNSLQVRHGHAWVYTKYCRDFSYWAPLEKRARQEHLGVWADQAPLAPWDYRKARKRS